MRRVLVTGGLGFIGSHLVERLLAGDAIVHIVDHGKNAAVEVNAFLGRLRKQGGRVRYDGPRWVASACESGEYDEIYHLASVVGPVGVLHKAGTIALSIISDACAVANLALACRARLCLVSTSEIYGGGLGESRGSLHEDAQKMFLGPATARQEYAAGKLAAEIATMNSALRQTVIIRPFNVAGPRQGPQGGFVLPRFVGQALAGKPLTVYGDGSARRAFTHVADICDGIVKSMQSTTSAAYNLGNSANETTILKLAQAVLNRTMSTSTIKYVDPRELHGARFAEAPDKLPDADLARRALGWSPAHGLDKIIDDTIQYIKEGRTD